jgi:hypothetical protein
MSDKWMPTTEQVRTAYAIDSEDEYRDPINAPANRRANERYFDRWLAAHDAQVAAHALRAVADEWVAHDYNLYAADVLRARAISMRSGTEGNTDVER